MRVLCALDGTVMRIPQSREDRSFSVRLRPLTPYIARGRLRQGNVAAGETHRQARRGDAGWSRHAEGLNLPALRDPASRAATCARVTADARLRLAARRAFPLAVEPVRTRRQPRRIGEVDRVVADIGVEIEIAAGKPDRIGLQEAPEIVIRVSDQHRAAVLGDRLNPADAIIILGYKKAIRLAHTCVARNNHDHLAAE